MSTPPQKKKNNNNNNTRRKKGTIEGKKDKDQKENI